MSALDELRFGPQRTLNLREHLPSAAEATRRCDGWLRQQQVHGSREVLIITGRGNQSIGGVPVVKNAIEKLLFSLRRKGVVASHDEHNPGAFAVRLASLRSLADAAPRRRDRGKASPASTDLHGLTRQTTALLRDLAERSLDALGVTPSEGRIADEMQRHLRMIVPALPADAGMEGKLRTALRSAIADYE